MSIDKETQVSASVVLLKDVYKEIQKITKENERSASAQMAYMIKQQLKIIKEG